MSEVRNMWRGWSSVVRDGIAGVSLLMVIGRPLVWIWVSREIKKIYRKRKWKRKKKKWKEGNGEMKGAWSNGSLEVAFWRKEEEKWRKRKKLRSVPKKKKKEEKWKENENEKKEKNEEREGVSWHGGMGAGWE